MNRKIKMGKLALKLYNKKSKLEFKINSSEAYRNSIVTTILMVAYIALVYELYTKCIDTKCFIFVSALVVYQTLMFNKFVGAINVLIIAISGLVFPIIKGNEIYELNLQTVILLSVSTYFVIVLCVVIKYIGYTAYTANSIRKGMKEYKYQSEHEEEIAQYKKDLEKMDDALSITQNESIIYNTIHRCMYINVNELNNGDSIRVPKQVAYLAFIGNKLSAVINQNNSYGTSYGIQPSTMDTVIEELKSEKANINWVINKLHSSVGHILELDYVKAEYDESGVLKISFVDIHAQIKSIRVIVDEGQETLYTYGITGEKIKSRPEFRLMPLTDMTVNETNNQFIVPVITPTDQLAAKYFTEVQNETVGRAGILTLIAIIISYLSLGMNVYSGINYTTNNNRLI